MPLSQERFICNSRLLVHDVCLRVCIHESIHALQYCEYILLHMHIRTYIVPHVPSYRLEIDQTSAVPPEGCSKFITAQHKKSCLLIKHAMFLHVYQKDGETIWKMRKSNLTCLVIFVLHVFLFCVCVVAKSPEAAWNGGEIYFLISCSHCFPIKSPLSFIETLSVSSPLIWRFETK